MPASKPEVAPAPSAVVTAPAAAPVVVAPAPAPVQAAPSPAPAPAQVSVPVAASTEAPLPKPAAEPQPEKRGEPTPPTPSPVQETKTVEAAPVTPPPSANEPIVASPEAVEAAPEQKPRTPVVPIELPSEPVGDMQVASHLELMTDSKPASPWERRAIEVDFSEPAVGSSEAGAFGSQGEVPLASVFEFIPSWDPSSEPASVATDSAATEGAEGSYTPAVSLEEALAALQEATTRGALGKALLSYCQGRFSRGFLLGESFGVARVGRAYGPGSNKPAVSALQVDLEAPSLLAMAAAGGGPIVSSVPESQEDEALFAALGESFSHLAAAAIRVRERPVGFMVIDGGPSPFDPNALDELEKLLSAASEAYGRLQDASP